jgi:hypothetical protein
VAARLLHNVEGFAEFRVDIDLSLFAMGFHGLLISNRQSIFTALPV